MPGNYAEQVLSLAREGGFCMECPFIAMIAGKVAQIDEEGRRDEVRTDQELLLLYDADESLTPAQKTNVMALLTRNGQISLREVRRSNREGAASAAMATIKGLGAVCCEGPVHFDDLEKPAITPSLGEELKRLAKVAKNMSIDLSKDTSYRCPPDVEKQKELAKLLFGNGISFPSDQ